MMSQMKGQDKTPEKQLNEVEIGNLPGKQFRIRMVTMIEDLGKIMEKMQEELQSWVMPEGKPYQKSYSK